MIITNLLTFHNQLKIWHWQTKSHAEHSAFGDIYGNLTDAIDEFVEVFMGKYGRIQSKENFNLTLVNYGNDVESKINEFIIYLTNELPDQLDEKDTDLLNIRDEMLGSVNKLKYLLTLK